MADLFNSSQFRFRQGAQNVVEDSLTPDHGGNFDAHHFNCREVDVEFHIAGRDGSLSTPNFYSQPTESIAQFQQCTPPSDQPSKRRAANIPARKAKKAKPTITLSDDDDGEDVNQVQRWTDPEVVQLIAFRSEMKNDFDKNFKNNPEKQGIHCWKKLRVRMVAACDNFSKSAESCRKKWNAVFEQYRNDKLAPQIPGEERKVTCKYFDEIDKGFKNSAYVRKYCHGDASGSPNPYPPDLNDQWEAPGMSKKVSRTGSKSSKKSPGEHIASLWSDMAGHSAEMVDCSRNMVTQTTRIADGIHSNGEFLKAFQFQMAKLFEKL